jgi:uncharacterized integral membrane protein
MSTLRNRAGSENLPSGTRGDRHVTARMVAAALLGALLTLFAVLNSQTVRIHWIVTTTNAPMIVVIVACGLVGAAIAWLVAWRRRRHDSAS